MGKRVKVKFFPAHISFRISESLRKRIEKRADEKGTTLTEIIRETLDGVFK